VSIEPTAKTTNPAAARPTLPMAPACDIREEVVRERVGRILLGGGRPPTDTASEE
jgi:hypothetical protein